MATQSKQTARKPSAAKAKGKATVTLAALTPETARKAASGMVAAAVNRESADGTFLERVSAAARLIKVPLTAEQYDKQVAPLVRDAFKVGKAKAIPEATAASYRSRFKTLTLALLSGIKPLQPRAGEAYVAYLSRAAEGVAKAKLPNGVPIWPADKARSGRAAGSKSPKPSQGAVAAPTGGHVEGSAANSGGEGLDMRRDLAAAMILCNGNAARAQRLCIAVRSYPAELDKWLSAILSDDDKAKLSKLTSVQTEEAAKRDASAPKVATPVPETAMAAAMVKAAKPKAAKANAA